MNDIDDEERQLIEAIECDDYQVGDSALTSERLQELQAIARGNIPTKEIQNALNDLIAKKGKSFNNIETLFDDLDN
ncbi:hypothetical protein [uncultured Candidatus Thioglobus sp.]|uniref:hypothetical protein n=1 Tax=uncultured Candidatus Thioglobus sp. TaxID=655186 RepID=UPI0032B1E5CE|nr:hypothetical protein [Candidatus Thioglobus sp.]MBT6752854.1 hypothetical protein [Candidatus Thioglobus sp.]MBT6967073.1 hypothetical protein [Candidatus Thioglobus sp.]